MAKPRTPYKRNPAELSPTTFTVSTRSGDVEITARTLKWHELGTLNASLIGEFPDGMDTGLRELEERRRKLAKVTRSVDTGDPADADVASANSDWLRFYRLDGNEDLAWLGWFEYLAALEGRSDKSSSADRSDGDGARGRAAGAGDGPDT